jgi:hypothetical protein
VCGPPIRKRNAEERLARMAGSPSSAREPLRRAYSREELASAMAEWMVNTFGHPLNDINDTDRLDRWYRDNGMLYQFICAHFPSENAIGMAAGAAVPPLKSD